MDHKLSDNLAKPLEFLLINSILRTAVFGLIYFVTALFSMLLVIRPETIQSVWPPTGLALAVLLLNKKRDWLLLLATIFLANTIASLLSSTTLPVSLALSLINCVIPVLTALILIRFINNNFPYSRVYDILAFFTIILASSAVTSLLGATIPALAFGQIYWRAWFTWWTSDSLGIILITPLILVWSQPLSNRLHIKPVHVIEGILLFFLVTAFSNVIFLDFHFQLSDSFPRAYLLFPFFLWAGLRFDMRYTTILLVYSGLFAVLGTSNNLGIFADSSSNLFERNLTVQLFIGVMAFSVYFLSAALAERKGMLQLLKEKEQHLRNSFENSPDFICTLDMQENKLTFLNRPSFWGYSLDDFNGIEAFSEFVHPDDRMNASQKWAKSLAGEDDGLFEYRLRKKGGDYGWIQQRTTILSRNPDLSARLLQITLSDVSERKRGEQALIRSEALLNETQEISKLGGWEYDLATNRMTWTDEVYRIFGVQKDFDCNDINQDLDAYLPEDRHLIKYALFRAVNQGIPYDLELRLYNSKQGIVWVRTMGKPVRENGKIIKVTGNIMDITAAKESEQSLIIANKKLEKQVAANQALQDMLIEQATHDTLTNLYNRRFMDDAFERELSRARREGKPISILLFDIDHFKIFNDTYGHMLGDQVLVALSELLRRKIRFSDIACRFGGDEFIIIMPGASVEDARNRAESIRADFVNHPMEVDGYPVKVTVSVGVAVYPQHGNIKEDLLRSADAAMYKAKQEGRNRVRLAWG